MLHKDHLTAEPCENDASSRESGPVQTRILARQLARPLTAEEIDVVAGGMRAAGGTCSAGTCCVPDCDD
ncbi:hypothetical protein [Azospirillum rugosum]|uniref:Bacteriocin-type signal sequence-containing protein n=1 Tax=Azospirillum rugosum TaxID=416170 RepID=A0ABS4SRC0_9PROT|nr:hypothetical protein [Azospirillum rugosum]MBP2294987.1 hypothetical protein [Azospirillum rugosum]MDQ0528810.1 hypothetical protein [Azospirillum rugosum]